MAYGHATCQRCGENYDWADDQPIGTTQHLCKTDPKMDRIALELRGIIDAAKDGDAEACKRRHLAGVSLQPLVERHGVGGQADEDEAIPLAQVVLPQRQGALVHVGVVEVRGGDELAVERIGPGVVRAHQ